MEQNYSIRIVGGTYSCISYEDITFDIPVLDRLAHPKDKKQESKETAVAFVKFTATLLNSLSGGVSTGPNGKSEESFSITKVHAIKLNTSEGASIFAFTPKELSWIRATMEAGFEAGGVHLSGELNSYMRSCNEFFANCKRISEHHADNPNSSMPYLDRDYLHGIGYTRNYETLYEVYKTKGRSTRILAVESLSSISKQFAQQDEKLRAIAEEKAREEDERRKAEAAEREKAHQAAKADRVQRQKAKEAAREKQRKANEAAQQARRSAEEARQKARIEDCRQNASTVLTQFEQEGLLQDRSLPIQEKLHELKRVRDFCIRYIPDLAEKDFQIKNHPVMQQGYIESAACESFAKDWSKISAAYFSLLRGIQGESKVAEVLRLFDDRLCFLQNYRWGHEHDFIVLAPTGIFTVEVKTLRGNYTLTETGILRDSANPSGRWFDVALQSKKHIETLRRKLSECSSFDATIPLQQIICSAEPTCTIKDEYHFIPVCYYNTLDQILLPAGDSKEVLSRKAMEEILSFLKSHQEEEHSYALLGPDGEVDDRESFIKNFSSVAGAWISAKKWSEGETHTS